MCVGRDLLCQKHLYQTFGLVRVGSVNEYQVLFCFVLFGATSCSNMYMATSFRRLAIWLMIFTWNSMHASLEVLVWKISDCGTTHPRSAETPRSTAQVLIRFVENVEDIFRSSTERGHYTDSLTYFWLLKLGLQVWATGGGGVKTTIATI